MKTRILSLVVALFATITLNAYDFQYGDLYYNITSDNTVEVVYDYDESYRELTVVVIPSTLYDYYNVTSIGYEAFKGCTGLTSITIPNSVTSIGDNAFSGCTGLTSITIPNSVTSIGDRAFYDCTSLKSVTIGNSVTDIGDAAFYGCTGLTSITIPNSVTSIGGSALEDCTGLTSITIPNSVTSIGWGAFSGCTGLTSITIPNSVTSIGWGAFKGCTGLTSITIPNSVTTIEYSAFEGCTSLASVTIPNSVTTIEYSAFDNTPWYNNLSDGPVYINTILYKYKGEMPQGTHFVVREGTTAITEQALTHCTGLVSFKIPSSVQKIGRDGRDQWDTEETDIINRANLVSIVVDKDNKVFDSRDNCNAIIEPATNKLVAGCKNTIIPNGTTSIGQRAFYGCTDLTSINIPSSVVSIWYEAFDECTNLVSVTFRDSCNLQYIASVDGSVFENTPYLK